MRGSGRLDNSSRTLLVVNPLAGNGRAARVFPRIASYLRSQGLRFETARPDSIPQLQQTARDAAVHGYRSILTLGGDGTFQHVVKSTLESDVVLGLLPGGGGNDIASGLGLPHDPVAAAHDFLQLPARRVDVVRARFASGASDIYVGAGGVGLDAEAARLAGGTFRNWRGSPRYIASALTAFTRFRPPRVKLFVDGSLAADARVLLTTGANAPAYGAGVRIAPEARMDDGVLDVVFLELLPWVLVLEAIPVLLRTGDLRWPQIRRFRARHVVLQTEPQAVFHGDGELLGQSPVELEVLPRAIQVAAPKMR